MRSLMYRRPIVAKPLLFLACCVFPGTCVCVRLYPGMNDKCMYNTYCNMCCSLSNSARL